VLARGEGGVVTTRLNIKRMTLVATAGLVSASFVVLFAQLPASAGSAYVRGDVLAGVGNGQIKEYKPDGTFVQTLNTTASSSEDTGMCFDPSLNLFSTQFEAGTVASFDNAGTLLNASWATGMGGVESCVLDRAGNVYVGSTGGFQRKFTPTGTVIKTYSGAGRTDWLDLAADQCTMFYTQESTLIKRYNVCTDAALPDFASGFGNATALRIRPGGDVMVADTTHAYHLNSSGTIIKTYTATAYNASESHFFALNLDPDGTSFWTAGYNTGAIYHIDIASGNLIKTFNASLNSTLAGLAVVGEPTVAAPTASPSPRPAAVATSPPGLPKTGTAGPSNPAALSYILGVGLVVGAGALLVQGTRRRSRRGGAS
jgi:hypothetical protein